MRHRGVSDRQSASTGHGRCAYGRRKDIRTVLAVAALPYTTPSRRSLHVATLAAAALMVVCGQISTLSITWPTQAMSTVRSTPASTAQAAAAPSSATSLAPVYPPAVERWRPLAQWAADVISQDGSAQVSPDLLLAVMQVESQGEVHALSPVGAVGLMQVRPATFQDMVLQHAALFSAADVSRPADNLLAGGLYLVFCAQYVGVDLADPAGLRVALNAYNLGPEAVRERRAAGDPSLPSETRLHADRILALYAAATSTHAPA